MPKHSDRPEKRVRLTIKVQNDALFDTSNEDYAFDYTDEEYENWLKTGKRTSKSSGVNNDTPIDVDGDGNFTIGDTATSAHEPDLDELLENLEPIEEAPKKTIPAPVFVTEGTIKVFRGHIEIAYNESDFTDMPDEITTLSYAVAEPGIITMGRNGACTTVMAFEMGKTYKSLYKAFGASFDVDITTHRLENTVSYDDGGEILLDYTVSSGGSLVSSAVMYINIADID